MRVSRLTTRAAHQVALVATVVVSGTLAVLLHRNGHTQGDDFALYLRQARSIFDGDIGAVVADNRFTIVNSASRFSPIAYPWGLPLLLSPFVKLWGFDYEKLKLVEVAAFCTWLVLVHGIVKRRAGAAWALAVVAVVGTAPALLAHTDQLLSEFPHAAAVGVVIWWLDRMRRRGALVDAATRDLVVLGVLVMVAFNVRRESIMIMAAIVMIQAVELSRRSPVGLWRRPRDQQLLKRLATPHVSFIASVALCQFLLPSMLFPANGGGSGFVPDRIVDYTGWLMRHLGLGWHPSIGAAVLIVALVGMIIGTRRRPGLDGTLAAVTLVSIFAVSTHFRMVDRYFFQVLPWIVYFVMVAIHAATTSLGTVIARGDRSPTDPTAHRRHRVASGVALAPLVFVITVHAAVLPGDIREAQRFNRDGRQQFGPTHRDVTPIYAAVSTHTQAGDVVAFFRARTMTLLTDRRSIQTSNVKRILQQADWFAQRRNSDYVQPDLTIDEAQALGFEMVWSDKLWILWRVPRVPAPLPVATDAATTGTPSGVPTVGTGPVVGG
jgi:hypothetical protein